VDFEELLTDDDTGESYYFGYVEWGPGVSREV